MAVEQRREGLPGRRAADTFELKHRDLKGEFAITIGYYEDGRPGEVFVSGAKAGSEVDAIARDGAILISLALQFGVPIDVLKHSITRTPDNQPSTIIGSVIDTLDRKRLFNSEQMG